MGSEITVTFYQSPDGTLSRGDYISFGHFPGDVRVTSLSGTTATIRPAHLWRIVERAHALFEDWIAWPLADLHRRFRIRS